MNDFQGDCESYKRRQTCDDSGYGRLPNKILWVNPPNLQPEFLKLQRARLITSQHGCWDEELGTAARAMSHLVAVFVATIFAFSHCARRPGDDAKVPGGKSCRTRSLRPDRRIDNSNPKENTTTVIRKVLSELYPKSSAKTTAQLYPHAEIQNPIRSTQKGHSCVLCSLAERATSRRAAAARAPRWTEVPPCALAVERAAGRDGPRSAIR